MTRDDSIYDEYLDAVLRGDAVAPEAFLGDLEDTSPELRERLEKIYAAARSAPADGADHADAGRYATGDRIGPYTIRALLGEGAFGAVYLAAQHQPVKRDVAIKIIKMGMDTRRVIARFEQEQQVLAVMDHPNVARVFDAGATDTGRPYFVMEHVRGEPITTYCDRERLSTRDRLALFLDVCRAVQHAHQKGIIHRDLKPANVLVAVNETAAVPKVIDFGIAKATGPDLTDKTIYTELNVPIGTFGHMSPEQAEMTGLDLDTRTDIYSLGVLLYELLTGTLPIDADRLRTAGIGEIQRIIREEEPPKPSTRIGTSTGATTGGGGRAAPEVLDAAARRRDTDRTSLGRSLKGDLDWIVMKCLEKDRTRRYATASELVSDIGRHLKDEPVLASPPSTLYRMRKFTRRNRAAVTAAAIVLITLAGASTIGIGLAISEAKQRDIAERSSADAQAIVAFQQQMLAEIEPEQLGGLIVERLREAVIDDLAGDKRAAASETFIDLVDRANRADLARTVLDEEILDRAVRTIDTRFARSPLVAAALRESVAEIYDRLGLYDKAYALAEQALAARRFDQGPEHADTITAQIAVAGMAIKANHLDDAGRMLTETLGTASRVFPRDARLALAAAHAQGMLSEARRDFETAEGFYRTAFEGREVVLGPDHIDTLESLSKLAFVVHGQGRLDEARPLGERALAGYREQLGDAHALTINALGNMSGVLGGLGEFALAEQHLRDALEASRKLRGDDHPETLTAMDNLSIFLRLMRRPAEAEPLCRESLAGRKRLNGRSDPRTLRAMHSLAVVLHDLLRHDEAEAAYRETLEAQTRSLGATHDQTLSTVAHLGMVVEQLDRLAEAEALYRQASDGRRRTTGLDDRKTASVTLDLARLMVRRGRAEEAEPFAEQAVEGLRASLGAEHWMCAWAGTIHGSALLALERFDDAEPVLLEAHRVLEAKRGARDSRTLRTVAALVQLYEQTGDEASAAAWRTREPAATDEGAGP